MRVALAFLLASATAATLSASVGPPVAVESRAKGAQQIVVGTVLHVASRFDISSYGDQLIVSDAYVQVDETLKGRRTPSLSMTLEGGTVGDLTLNVSDMPSMKAGDRAVLFLDESASGRNVPHGRGLGILMLDADERIHGSGQTLAEIKDQILKALR